MNQFDILFEKELERFQQGGIVVGDRVKFKPNVLELDYFKKRGQSFRDIVTACMADGFDLALKVGAVKSIYPTTTQNYGNGTEAPDGIFYDVYIEYAPGLFRNPMTVPIEAIEVVGDGINLSPIPDSLRRNNNIHGPEEIKAEPDDVKAEINLTNKNAKLPGANKWDDTKPGGGNFKPKL